MRVRWIGVAGAALTVLLAFPAAGWAASPTSAVIRLKTGTLRLTSAGAGIAPAVVTWTKGTSQTSGVGCCTYDVYDPPGSPAGEATASSWPVALEEGSAHAFQIDAYDANGAYVGSVFTDPPGYSDGFGLSGPGAFTYSGAWQSQSLAGAWGGTVEDSIRAGSSATLTFAIRAFELVMTKGPAYGKARITVDGASTVVNLHATTLRKRQIVLVRNYAEDPAEASPTVTITNLGTHGHSRIDINAVGGVEID